MDYNSKELYLAFLRREEKIKNLIDEVVSIAKEESDTCNYTKGEFLTEVCWQVSDSFGEKIKEDIIHSWVRRNFRGYINKLYYDILRNCDEGYDYHHRVRGGFNNN